MPPRHPAASEPLRKSNETAHRVRYAVGPRLAGRRPRRRAAAPEPRWSRRSMGETTATRARYGRDPDHQSILGVGSGHPGKLGSAPVHGASRVRILAADADWARSPAKRGNAGADSVRRRNAGADSVRRGMKPAQDGPEAGPVPVYGAFRVRIPSVGETRVRPLSIEARKTALDGHNTNPEIADGQKPNPGCPDARRTTPGVLKRPPHEPVVHERMLREPRLHADIHHTHPECTDVSARWSPPGPRIGTKSTPLAHGRPSTKPGAPGYSPCGPGTP